MMALSLLGELVSQNVVDIRAIPVLANWASMAMGICIGMAFTAACLMVWELNHAR